MEYSELEQVLDRIATALELANRFTQEFLAFSKESHEEIVTLQKDWAIWSKKNREEDFEQNRVQNERIYQKYRRALEQQGDHS